MYDGATALPPAAIDAILDGIRRGEPWRRALEAVAVASGSTDAIERIASEACGNWVWLTSFGRRDAALDIGGAVSGMAPALSRHFAVVHHVESSALLAEFAARRFAQDGLRNVVVWRALPMHLPFPDGSFDCLTLHGVIPRLARNGLARSVPDVVQECRRVLRPGGRLYIAHDNPLWYGRLARPMSWRSPETAVAPAARTVGFHELDRLYIFPTFGRPSAIVPGARRAFCARETLEVSSRIRRAVRRAVAWCGLYPALAPSVAIVARK